jgi:hypothetical protein
MGGAIPPLPNTPSWRGAQLKHRDNFMEVKYGDARTDRQDFSMKFSLYPVCKALIKVLMRRGFSLGAVLFVSVLCKNSTKPKLHSRRN